MQNVLDEIAQYLADNAVGTRDGSSRTIYLAKIPDAKNVLSNIIVLLNTGGLKPDLYLPQAHPTVQVYVRNKSYIDGFVKCNEITGLLHNKYNLQLADGGNYYYRIALLGEINHIGRDMSNRDEFTMNFELLIRDRN